MEPKFIFKGLQDALEIFEDHLTITPKGVFGLANKGLKGSKTIPFQSISAIQFKKGGMGNGYIQFSLLGGVESRGGLMDATHDENTVMFGGWGSENKKIEEIKNYIETRMVELRNTAPAQTSVADELSKLNELKQQGVLSEEEFEAAKKKILG